MRFALPPSLPSPPPPLAKMGLCFQEREKVSVLPSSPFLRVGVLRKNLTKFLQSNACATSFLSQWRFLKLKAKRKANKVVLRSIMMVLCGDVSGFWKYFNPRQKTFLFYLAADPHFRAVLRCDFQINKFRNRRRNLSSWRMRLVTCIQRSSGKKKRFSVIRERWWKASLSAKDMGFNTVAWKQITEKWLT